MSEGWQDVDSSCLSEVGYDLPTQILYLTFKKTGLSYMYPGVPQHVYEALMAAGSHGVYFTSVIKPTYPAVETWATDA